MSGRPVCLMSHQDGELKVNEDAFNDILKQHNLLGRKLVVISIVGDYRTGKSFFLNYALRYLINEGKTNWFEDDGVSKLPGFNWRRGLEKVTDGIIIWSQAFPLGNEYAVILLDTEGMNDEQATTKAMSQIFACSALNSSLQILNVMDKINKKTVQDIQLYAEFGRLANDSESQSAFQDLMILIRDWSFEDQHSFGTYGGQKHLEHWLNSDTVGVRDTLDTCYDQISCYLMPSPGYKVIKDPCFQGNFEDMNPDCEAHLISVIELIFAPENLKQRVFRGKPLYLFEFMEYFKISVKSLDESGVEPMTLFQTQIQVCNINAKEIALKYYEDEMDAVTESDEPRDDLTQVHENISKEALSIFECQPKLGGEKHTSIYKNILINDIKLHYSKYLNMQTRKQVMKSKIDEKEKGLWEAENTRLKQELQHKQDMETARLKEFALEKRLIAAEKLAMAEDFKLRLHSLEQKAAMDRMETKYEFQLKLIEMQREADANRAEMEKEMRIFAEESKKRHDNFINEADKIIQEQKNSSIGFLDFFEGFAKILTTQPISDFLSFLFQSLKNGQIMKQIQNF